MTHAPLQFGMPPKNGYKERISAYAYLLNEEQKLLTIDVNGEFTLPGGGIDEGEEAYEAVIRETLEETGCVVDNLKLIGHASQYFEQTGLGPLNKIATFYSGTIISIDASKIIEQDHITCWLTIEDFLNSNAPDFFKWGLKEFTKST